MTLSPPFQPTKVGIIGCGNISGAYLKSAQKFDILDVVSVADLDLARAQAKAAEFSVPNACLPDDLLLNPEIEIVINLTVPKAHYSICLQALESGKHVHVEKPLSIARAEGKHLVDLAAAKNLRIGAAPDTFLGRAQQTCRKVLDDGVIGTPIGATAFMLGRGPEGWHPDPEFFYKTGGGPMFDMGPYYLTSLINLMGPIRRVTGSAQISFPERPIGSEPKKGQIISVEVPTHIAGVMDFANGAVGTILMSFDVWHSQLPRIELYGSEGSLMVPDPNNFDGKVLVRVGHEQEWREIEPVHGFAENSRGIGAADMAYAIQSGRPHRASGQLAYHVLDAMHGFEDASKSERHYQMSSTCERPAPLSPDWPADEA